MGEWMANQIFSALAWLLEAWALGNMDVILVSLWVILLFLFKSTRPFAVGSIVLYLAFSL